MFRWSVLSLVFIVLFGCAGTEEKSELLSLLGVDEKIVDETDQEAADTYDAITLLKRGEAYYVKGDYIEAVAEFDRFLSLHPFHRMAAFSQYKLAMSFYHQIHTVDRDPAPMQKAVTSFQKVVSQYPRSLYIDEAIEKIKELKHRQAEHQFYIGHFYYRTHAYPAAIARFEKILARVEIDALTEKTLYFLGRSHFDGGDPEKSLEVFQHLLEKFPASSYRPKVQKIHPQIETALLAS